MTTDGLLLDTCALIWLSQGEFIRLTRDRKILAYGRAGYVKMVLC